MNSRKHWRPWIWLCPLIMIGLAVAVLFNAGLTIWTAVLTAMLLACPAIILWGVFHNKGTRRLEANTTHEERDDHGS